MKDEVNIRLIGGNVRKSLIEIVLKHPYNADLNLNFSDSVLNELVAEKVNLPGVAAIDIIGMENCLLIRAHLGISRRISKKEEITLVFDGFQSNDNAALLSFKIGGSIVLQKAISIGVKTHEFVSMKEGKLFVDLFKIKLLEDNKLIKDYFKSLRHFEVYFSPGTISVKVKLLHEIQAV
jgi:hypothetical protein